jgi:hypothetical protein
MTDRAQVTTMLSDRGAATIDHPGGTLLEHLGRVATVLDSWGARDALATAGLAHAMYGTDGYDVSLFSIDERPCAASIIGPEAEAIVYRYASCDRRRTLGQIARNRPVSLRDRFTGSTEVITDEDLADFAELMVANEVDLARHSVEFRRTHWAVLGALFSRWEGLVTDAAYEACLALDHAPGADR